MRSIGSRLSAATGALAAGGAALAWAAYRRDIKAAIQRVETGRQAIDSPHGPIEFAEAGDGQAVLLIHGAGGGFDQGLDLGRPLVAEGYRVVAPSRFGYLGTPLPQDASPQAQADAHLRLLDALGLEAVPVVAFSAGGPSAVQLALKHPERCTSLVLVVPMAYAPARETAPSRLFEMVLGAIGSSDLLFWIATRVARPALIKTILGTPVSVYQNATAEERTAVDEVLRNILPVSRRAAGIANDAVVSSHLTAEHLEEVHVPTLVISAADDLYRTYESGLYTADRIHRGQFVGFAQGGHLLLGHDAEVRSEIARFLREPVPVPAAKAAV